LQLIDKQKTTPLPNIIFPCLCAGNFQLDRAIFFNTKA